MIEVAVNSNRDRVSIFDTVRGLTVVSMVTFHVSYDLAYLYGIDMPWFTGTIFQDIWRASISWTFLFLAGWMTSLSRDNWKRAGVYALVALVVFLATSIVAVDTPVSYGIIYCMAASTAIHQLSKGLLQHIPPLLACLGLFALFLATQGIPQHLYALPNLAWLGFPSVGFASGDYYPIIPYTFMYLFGAYTSRAFIGRTSGRYPAWMMRDYCPPLSWIGRKSLIIYVLHQPIALGALMLVLGS